VLITDGEASGDLTKLIRSAREETRHSLLEPEAKAFLRAHGISVPAARFVGSATEAGAAVAAIGAPVVVKAVAPQLTHKSDVGGVIFPVTSPAAAAEACKTISENIRTRRPDITLAGFLIEAFRPGQPEWIAALRNDPDFGPVIMFGLGGLLVEMLRQVSFRLAPLGEADIAALLNERTALLTGARGQPPADRAALADVLRRLSELSQLPEVASEIEAIEINPIVVGQHGALALDALIVLRA
jgi:succinyl-CoA synthetase beta subunit